jgi:hypothetical protein
MSKKPFHKNLVFCVSCTVFILLVLLAFYWKFFNSSIRFNLIILMIGTRYLFLYAAVILILLRLLKLYVASNSVAYILASLFNILIGFLTLIFYFFHQSNIWWLNQTLLNLLFGMIMILDIFIFSNGRPLS